MTKTSNNLRPDINFLFEIGNLRFIPRMGNRFLRGLGQNLAEHHFRAFWIIAGHEGGDTGKIAKDADNLDIDFDLFEQASMGNALRGHWQEARRFIAKEKFYTKTAKELFAQLEDANLMSGI